VQHVDPVTVITATLAPIFLVSGASIFLNFLQARLFRVMDRIRAHGKTIRHLTGDDAGDQRAYLESWRDFLLKRARIIRNAIAFGVMTLVMTCLAAILLIAPILLQVQVPAFSAVLVFTIGLLAFLASLALGLRDTMISVRSVAWEMAADERTEEA
jgi:hypothetical protein